MCKRVIHSGLIGLFFSLHLLSSHGLAGAAEPAGAPPGAIISDKVTSPGISNQLNTNGTADVIISLDDTDARVLAKRMRSDLKIKNDNAASIRAKAEVFKHDKEKVLGRLSPGDYRVLRDYENLPIVFLKVNEHALQAFLQMSEVKSIGENRTVKPFYTDSQNLINAPAAWSYCPNCSGGGNSVAVLDTGIDYTASGLSACAAPGDPGCIGYESCFASGGCYTDKSHGSNVSGIVFQVAPETEVLALDVFTTSGQAYYSDILDGINWVIGNQSTYNIVAVNMSFGDGQRYTSACPSDSIASAISTLKSSGISSAVASGNDTYTDGLDAPACAPDAISVGAVYASNYGPISYSVCSDSTSAADRVTCFSNSASFLSMLAPGALITAGGYEMAGTSQATPHVAGAISVLKSQSTALTSDEVSAVLKATGNSVLDYRNSITTPRLNLSSAVSNASPIIMAVPSSLSFMAAQGGVNPTGQTVDISNGGGGTLDWFSAADPLETWASVAPANGADPGTITVNVDTSTMATPGVYTSTPQISSAGALNSPLTIPVTLQLIDAAYSEDFETGGLAKFPWTTGGNGSWSVGNSVVHTGNYAAQAQLSATPQTNYLEVILNVTSQDYVYFWLKTVTQPTWNYLKFRIDGNNAGSWDGWSGNTDWTFIRSNYEVSPGIHAFRWEFSTSTAPATADSVWIDDIFFPASNEQVPFPSLSPASIDFGSLLPGASSSAQRFTLTNTGSANLMVGTANITGTDGTSFSISSDSCSGQTITPSGTCTVQIKFSPSSTGTKSAQLSVSSDYPHAATAGLSGSGAFALTINKTGSTGSGMVTSSPGTISCGIACSGAYAPGTPVTLTAVPDADSTFGGWSGGGCSGADTCNVTMNTNTAVTALFNILPPVADFSGDTLTGTAPLLVNFSDASTNSPTAWQWSFGDAETATVKNPSHTYRTAGTFTVSLGVSNQTGSDAASKTDYITVDSCLNQTMTIFGSGYVPVSIQDAYDYLYNNNIVDGVIQVQAFAFAENLVLAQPLSLTLSGGFNCDYSADPSDTLIQGSLTVNSGTLTVENVTIE